MSEPTSTALAGFDPQGRLRWCSPVAAALSVVRDPRTADTAPRALTGWVDARLRTGALGPLAACRDAAGGGWLLTLEATGDGTTVSGRRWPLLPGELDLTPVVSEAIGFQLSHTLRAPLARLAGHHQLAARALGDPDEARAQLDGADALVTQLLTTADTLVDGLRVLLQPEPEGRRSGAALASDVGRLVGDATGPPTIDAPRARVDLTDAADPPAPRGLLAVPSIGVPADVLARVLALLDGVWELARRELHLPGEIRRLPATPPSPTGAAARRRVPASGVADQAFTIGRAIAAAAPLITIAADLGVVIRAGGRLLLAPAAPERDGAPGTEHATGPTVLPADTPPATVLARLSTLDATCVRLDDTRT